MKKIKIIVSALIIMICSLSSAYSETSSLKIGGDVYYPPYEYIDENGIYKGFNVDITNAISLELGVDIQLKPMEWNSAMEKLKNGELDALQGALNSDERKKYFDFSDELLKNSLVIFVRSDNQFIKDINDLSGLKVAIQNNDLAYEHIRNIDNLEVLQFKSQDKAIKSLLDSQVDAFIGDRLTGLYFVQKNRYFEDIKISGQVSETVSYGFAVSKGDKDTLKLINKGIADIKSNGTYQKIYKKWFGEEIANIGKWKNLFYVTIIILLATVAFILIMAHLNRVLKKEVYKRTEQLQEGKLELAKKDRLKGKIIENVYAGIVAFDSNGIITNINEFAKKALEIDLVEGDRFENISILSSSDFNSVKQLAVERPIEEEVVFRSGSDNEKTLVYKLLPISDKTKSDGLLFCIFDLTEERNLNRLIAHSDKMQSLGVLSAGIAHEIRNPLTSIKMFVDLVPIKGSDTKFLEKFTKTVPSELNRLSELTSVLLDYAKPSSSKPTEVEFKEIAESVLMLIKPYFKKSQIKIIKDYNEIRFWADPSQLKQILLNIILNSVDAIKEQGTISISASESSDRIHIKVDDNGSGIDENLISKIFDPFYTSKKYGYGIGLSITKNLVSENSGTIEIESEKNKGTTVKLSFPKQKQTGGNNIE